METYLTGQLLASLSEGNATKFVAYLAIFLFIWLEVRGMRKELKTLNGTITKSFADGEKRFDAIEANNTNIEHRLTVLEQHRSNQ